MSTSTLFGRALTPAERRTARFADALHAFRLNSGLLMVDDDEAAKAKAAAEAEAAAKKKADDDAAAAAKKKADEEAAAAAAKEKGYPPNTRPEDMKPEQQAAYYREQARKHENRNKELLGVTGGKYGDDLKAQLDRLAELEKAQLSDQEKAIADAKDAAKAEVTAEFAPKLASMAFDIALAHIPETDRVKLIETLDLAKFVDPATGTVNTDKVAETAALIAPPAKGSPGSGRPDYGAGRRTDGAAGGVAAGRSRYQERFGKKKADA